MSDPEIGGEPEIEIDLACISITWQEGEITLARAKCDTAINGVKGGMMVYLEDVELFALRILCNEVKGMEPDLIQISLTGSEEEVVRAQFWGKDGSAEVVDISALDSIVQRVKERYLDHVFETLESVSVETKSTTVDSEEPELV